MRCATIITERTCHLMRIGKERLSAVRSGCRNLSDNAVNMTISRCTRLKNLSLAMMGQLSDDALTMCGIGNRAQKCLYSLDVTGCGGISYMALERAMCGDKMGGLGYGLRELSLRGHVAMPMHGVLAVLHPCLQLQKLDLSCCLSVTDETVRAAFLSGLWKRSNGGCCGR